MSREIYVLLGMVLCGAAAGVLFDLRRGVNKTLRPPDFITAVSDFLFWIICAVAAAWCIWTLNYGIVRAYEFIGLSLGALLYFLTLSRFVLSFFSFIADGIFKIIAFILKILLTPIRFLYKIICSIHTKRNKKEGPNGDE